MFGWRRFQSEEIRSTHRKIFIWQCTLVVGACVTLVFGIAGLTSLPQLAFAGIRVDGVQAIDPADVYELVTPLLSGRALGIIDRANRFAFSDNRAITVLSEALPRIESVAVMHDDKDLVITITERVATAVACEIEALTGCLLVDANGYQFAPTELIGNLFMYRTEPQLRAFVRPTEEFVYLRSMRERLAKLGLYATSLTLAYDEMTLNLANGTRIRFGIDDHERQFENLATILRSKEYAEETGGDITRVEYFDLRFGDRVYYRLIDS